jgi:hypothetical protein
MKATTLLSISSAFFEHLDKMNLWLVGAIVLETHVIFEELWCLGVDCMGWQKLSLVTKGCTAHPQQGFPPAMCNQ